jgi:Tfp pilus assembly protein PilF
MISSRGGLNEVLLLLCMERNATALSKCNEMMTLPEYNKNAKFWYIHAVCANRQEDVFTAMTSLEMALMLDPSLEETARLDSDAMDVIELIRPLEENKN